MRPAPSHQDRTGKGKALCVDDDPDMVEAVKETLERALPLLVDTARSGEDALRLMRDTDYDVIVSDHQMPGMDGLTFLGKAREISPTTARIMVSALNDPILVESAIETGEIMAFFSKPFDAKRLIARVGRAIAERRADLAQAPAAGPTDEGRALPLDAGPPGSARDPSSR